MRTRFFAVCSVVFATATASLAATTTLDFETAGQYTGNFRLLAGSSTQTQTGPSAGNDYVISTSPTAANASIVFDTTPADATFATATTFNGAVTVSLDALFQANSSSLGIYFINPADETKSYLALFNVNNNGNENGDLIRFASDANPSVVGAGTLNAGKAGDASFALNNFSHITVQYSVNASNNPVLTMTAGSLSDSVSFGSVTAPSSVEIGLRLSPKPTPGDVYVDNFSVSSTPEPSCVGLLGAGGLLLMRRRRSGR